MGISLFFRPQSLCLFNVVYTVVLSQSGRPKFKLQRLYYCLAIQALISIPNS